MRIADELRVRWSWPVFVLGICIGATGTLPAANPPGPLRVCPANPRYFTDDSGKAIYLAGSHTWRNVQDSSQVTNFNAYLDFLQQHCHNFTRLWVYRGTPGGPVLTPTIYVRSGPGVALDGGLKYDLSNFNQAFFDQLQARCQAAQARGIYVQVMLDSSETARTEPPGNLNWPAHPYHRANNINGIDGDPNGDKWGYEIFGLQSVALTALNEAYARKIVDTLNNLDNVLYEIVNEANHDSKEFQYHLIRYLQNYEKKKPKRHPVGMTAYRDPGNEPAGANSDLMTSPADFIAPALNPYRDDPPAASGNKVFVLDTDHLEGGEMNWVWKTFTRGMNALYMDDWHRSDPTREVTRQALGHTVAYARRMDLSAMTPRNDLASSSYCLANVGRQYLIFLPAGLAGGVTVDLRDVSGAFAVEWFNPRTGASTGAGSVQGAAKRSFNPPFPNEAVLYLVRGEI